MGILKDFFCYLDNLFDLFDYLDCDDECDYDDDDCYSTTWPSPRTTTTREPESRTTHMSDLDAPAVTNKSDCQPLDKKGFRSWCNEYLKNPVKLVRYQKPHKFECKDGCNRTLFYNEKETISYQRDCNATFNPNKLSTVSDKFIMNDNYYRTLRDYCANFVSGQGFPIYAIILIVLGVLAALIGIGAFFWNRKQERDDRRIAMSRIASGIGGGGQAISAIPTQRSTLPSTGPARMVSRPAESSLSSRARGGSFNRLTVGSKKRGSNVSRSRSGSLSGSLSGGRPKRLSSSNA